MHERLPLSWRLAQALLSKQQRASWCGLSFPLSWPCYSMGVRGVWEKPVWKRREEVCIYLCWWGMIPTLICLQTSSWTALRAAEAISSTCQPQRVSNDAWTAPVKIKTISQVHLQQVQSKSRSFLLTFITFVKWLTALTKTYAHMIFMVPCRDNFPLPPNQELFIIDHSTAIKGFKQS